MYNVIIEDGCAIFNAKAFYYDKERRLFTYLLPKGWMSDSKVDISITYANPFILIKIIRNIQKDEREE